jgi:hypothetical protein
MGNHEKMHTAHRAGHLPLPILLKVHIDGGEADFLASAEECRFLQELWWIIETPQSNSKNSVFSGSVLTTTIHVFSLTHGDVALYLRSARWSITAGLLAEPALERN